MAQAEVHNLDKPNYGHENEEWLKFFFKKFHIECLPILAQIVFVQRQCIGASRYKLVKFF